MCCAAMLITMALTDVVVPDAAAATARAGMQLAAAAADAWADDARLVWIENDTPIDPQGDAAAWGYLYYSASLHAMRSWSIKAGEIVHAEDQAVIAAAPPIAIEWQDSDAMAGVAWRELGSEIQASGAALENLVLARGVFAEETAWVAVFAVGDAPRHFLLFDAKSGGFIKRWRG
jgi:hypothetical protein